MTKLYRHIRYQVLASALGRSMAKDPGYGVYSRKTRALGFLVGGRKLYQATKGQ